MEAPQQEAAARVRVKICGITTPEDALAAIEAGAHALGFNFWPGSKRYISPEVNASWIRRLPPFVTRVAVLVNAPLDEARRIAENRAFDMVQFHGDESPEYLAEFASTGLPFILAVRPSGGGTQPPERSWTTPYLLLDAAVPGAYGGTGQSVDLEVARAFIEANREAQVILAGGLTPENVGSAVSGTSPFAVDVASGVESAPGRKDAAKMRAFVAATRS